MPKNFLVWFGYAVALFAIFSGGGGMCLSLMQMSCAETPDIIAGGMCFIAGAVLVGAGVVALAVLSLASVLTARNSPPPASDSGA
jgi:hypothetical protein